MLVSGGLTWLLDKELNQINYLQRKYTRCMYLGKSWASFKPRKREPTDAEYHDMDRWPVQLDEVDVEAVMQGLVVEGQTIITTGDKNWLLKRGDKVFGRDDKE